MREPSRGIRKSYLGSLNRRRTSSEVANKVAERFGVAEY